MTLCLKKTTLGVFLTLFCLLGSGEMFASGRTKTIVFKGQASELVELEMEKKETRYREEQYEDTCTRQVPHTEYRCENVTRYRQECSTFPGENRCRTVNDPICSTEYRQECRTEYEQECENRTERVCNTRNERVCESQTTYERQCRTVPGEQICRDVNGRRECRQAPSREVCENVPRTRQVCRDVPRQECRNETRRECRNVPRQRCENRPQTVCRDNYRQVCEWIPPRQDCRSVPYQEQVCGNHTTYRTETYACTQTRQVPYEVTVGKATADIDFDFAKIIETLPEFSIESVLKLNGVDITVPNATQNGVLVRMKKDIQVEQAGDDTLIKGTVEVSAERLENYRSAISRGIEITEANKNVLELQVGKVNYPARTSLSLKIARGSDILINKTLTQGQFTFNPNNLGTIISIDLEKLGVKVKRLKKHEVVIGLEVVLPDDLANEGPLPTISLKKTFEQKF